MSKDRLSDLLALNEVPRWNSRVKLLRRQTVAEHTFNVMAIAYEIVCKLESPNMHSKTNLTCEVLQWGLVHDGPECETGDINYLFKRHMDRRQIDALEIIACPWYGDYVKYSNVAAKAIVKIADKCEEYLFIQNWGAAGTMAKWGPGILSQIADHVSRAYASYGWTNLASTVTGIIDIDPTPYLDRDKSPSEPQSPQTPQQASDTGG
jgi:5'-deoxynucleotidase YfbR-like HD superfamily hydrolase